MQIGISLQNNQGIEDVQSIIQLARRAEALGFASVWVHDHVFNAAHVFRRIGNKPYYDPLTLLSYVAACTQRVSLGTSVLVLPYHNPLRLAKTAATLDVLSGGRLILGVGVGAVPQESEALGSPYAERGAITDEAIAIMKELWTKEDPSFAGKYYRFSGMPFSPKPLQKPHIPILIGGNSRAAIRRAVRVRQWLASIRYIARDIAPRYQLSAGVCPKCWAGCDRDSGLFQYAAGEPDCPWGRVRDRATSHRGENSDVCRLGRINPRRHWQHEQYSGDLSSDGYAGTGGTARVPIA
jgi:probable F420-dependent oxidoreductase